MTTEKIESFGDARRIIIDTILGMRAGSVTAQEGMAMAANMKVLNDNIQVEINSVKIALLAQKEGADFGNIVPMGARLITNNMD
tara:strand:+ start:1837 stop:2088 length:252 start_codon:yes stop_codon:yes gene_type:complete